MDRSPETAAEAKQAILSQYDDLALRSGKSVHTGSVILKMDNEINSLQGGVGRFSDSNQSKIEELLRRKSQFLESVGADATQSPIKIKVKDATLFRKESLDPDIPQSMFGLDAHGSGKAKGAKATRDILREVINSSDPRLKQLGLDYGMAKGVEKIITAAQSRGNNRSILNIFKLGSAGIGGMLGGIPGAVGGYVMEQVVNHPLFIAQVSSVLGSGATGQEAVNKILQNPQIQQLIYQSASRAGEKTSHLFRTKAQTSQKTGSTLPQTKKQSYTPSVPQTTLPKSTPSVQSYTLKVPKNIFKSNASFSKVKKLKKGSFS